MIKRKISKLTATLVFILACAILAAAQGAAPITGRVSDPQGASVAGAIVTLIARDNRVRVTATTDATGNYRFERLAAGEYGVFPNKSHFCFIGIKGWSALWRASARAS